MGGEGDSVETGRPGDAPHPRRPEAQSWRRPCEMPHGYSAGGTRAQSDGCRRSTVETVRRPLCSACSEGRTAVVRCGGTGGGHWGGQRPFALLLTNRGHADVFAICKAVLIRQARRRVVGAETTDSSCRTAARAEPGHFAPLRGAFALEPPPARNLLRQSAR